MGTVRYTTVEGEILAEKRNGVRNLYVPDPLGSTVALLNSTQTQTDTFAYWPYGEDRVRTGTTPTPFQFVGSQGCYKGSSNQTYIRARMMDTQQGFWITEDPLGINSADNNRYRYVGNNPTTLIDPTGEKPDCIRRTHIPKIPCPSTVGAAKKKICDALTGTGQAGIVATKCVTGPKHAQCLIDWCKESSIYCHPTSSCTTCGNSCTDPGHQHPNYGVSLCWPTVSNSTQCKPFSCSSSLIETILHEMNGVCGVSHDPETNDPCDVPASCLCKALGL